MRNRLLLPAVIAALAGLVAALPGQQPVGSSGLFTHREGFSGRQPVWVAADANVPYQEKDHRIVPDRYFNAPSSEYLKIDANPARGGADAEFVHYSYTVPPAPISEKTAASLQLRSFRTGIQLRARVVLPREKDPKNPDAAFTTVIAGESYPEEKVQNWGLVKLDDAAGLLRKQLPVLTARLGHPIDPTDAYIDRLILNVYAGPGVTEIWIDDLEIGPCRPDPKNPGRGPATTAGRTKSAAVPFNVEFAGGKILVDKKPFFMRGIRHPGTGPAGLKEMRDAKFNTVFLPADAEAPTIEDAVTTHGFFVVPGVPQIAGETPVGTNAPDREADRLAEHFRRFRSGDGVLMWDLGGGRTTEQYRAVARTADLLREYDPRRPRAVDLWDGYQYYSENLDAIGAHRWPLFTSLEMDQYRLWLMQRRALTAPGKLLWTWVQAHAPEWYTNLATGQSDPAALTSPLGPEPAQIRILTYLSIAAGCRGLGFWGDKYLANSHFGRDRLLELFLLNTELELLEPVLFAVEDEKTQWVPTSDANVMAAVLRGRKGIVVLPVWIGPGSQHTPGQASVQGLKIRVDMVPEGADPWLLSAAAYENLRNTGGVREMPPGVEITIPQFDTAAAVVFTNDTSPDGLVVRWQDNIRHVSGPVAARYAREMAVEEYNKVAAVHERLVGVAPPVVGADELLKESRLCVKRAERYLDNQQSDMAYREARRAARPLRLLMRDHWENATKTLSVPTASPYAASYYTLPQHWALFAKMQPARPGANVLPYGNFELDGPIPEGGAAVDSLPGWGVRSTTLDAVVMQAAIVGPAGLKDKPPPPRVQPQKPGQVVGRYSSSRVEAAANPPARPGPDTGRCVLKLDVKVKKPKPLKPLAKGPDGKPIEEEEPPPPGALERTFLAVDTPAVQLPPGTWVRMSFWTKITGIYGTADGVIVFDSAGGEPLSARLADTYDTSGPKPRLTWREIHLYRQVPASGRIGLTFAITGLGTAYFDDVRIEPMTAGGTTAEYAPGAVVPAGGR